MTQNAAVPVGLEQRYQAEGVTVTPYGWNMTVTEMLSCLRCEPKTESDQLRAKLDLIIGCLERFELYFRAEGLAFTPHGWNMTVTEMLSRLKE